MKKNNGAPKKVLGFFSLVMINIIAVDSLRSLPISAEYGLSLIFFYLIAAIFFFIPSMFITAELATTWPNTGGIYVWAREAFGLRVGFFAIWFQWIYNVIWYPTIMVFIVSSIAYLFNPGLIHSKIYMLPSIIFLFWMITLANCFGMRISSWISILGAILGTLVPMIFIISLGVLWVVHGHDIQVHFSWHSLFPNCGHLKNLAFLSAIIFGLIGLEMSASHAGEVEAPEKIYSWATFVAGIIILISLILASLAIAIVVPKSKISLITGLLQAYSLFFSGYHLQWVTPIIVVLIIIGGISGVAAWIIGPSKGLLVAARDGIIPPLFGITNRNGAPIFILILQGIVFTLLCIIFLLFPNINSSYWLLSAMTAQLGLVVYIILFSSAIRLRFKKPKQKRHFRIPGGTFGIILLGGFGICGCIVAILLGFLPPQQLKIGEIFRYEIILVTGIFLFCIPPFLFINPSKK